MTAPGTTSPTGLDPFSELPQNYRTGQRAFDFLKRILPPIVLDVLRLLRGRVDTRGFPRNTAFVQSSQDARSAETISIIVPIHDAPRVLRRCLASLEMYAAEAEIILVDDASKLPETRKIIDEFAKRNHWTVARNDKPAGHSEACRRGAELSTRPYLCLLNSDTVVTPWCWRQAKDAFELDRAIGVVGPSTSISGTTQALPVARTFCSYWNQNQICYFANLLLTQTPDPILVDLPWVSGFAFFIRRSLWQELGGFDRNLPDYGNERELCMRLRESGHRVVWIRNSYIHHFGSESYRRTIGEKGIQARVQNASQYISDRLRSEGK